MTQSRRNLAVQCSEDSKATCFGLLQTHPNPDLSEIVGLCGYEFVILDGEHGLFTEADYLNALRALEATSVTRLIRLRSHDPHALGHYLDLGADGIIVPGVSTVEQAQSLVRAISYPPQGTRGFAASLHRSTGYGMELPTHLQNPKGGALLLVIIESLSGVENADAIVEVDGIDGVIVGPFDLSANMGHLAQFTQPAFQAAVERIESAARAHKKLLGTAPYPGSTIESLRARGHRLFILGADMLLIRDALSLRLQTARASLSSTAS